MAKRTSNRSQPKANDTSTAAPAQPRSRRPRGATAAKADTLTSFPDVERTEDDDAALNAASGDQQPASAFTSEPEIDWQSGLQTPPQEPTMAQTSSSMGSEPSVDDIRMRAYQRYLERGGREGMAFDDWLEAERDLRNKK
jgi:hypothetical protein